MTNKQFEYLVCALQNNRVTFVNGEWQGQVAAGAEDPNRALNSCPTVWDFLQAAGSQGWELVTAFNQPHPEGVPVQALYLKRMVEQA